MSQAVKHICISRAHMQLLLLSLAFSRCSFCKTEQNGTGHDSCGGVIKRGSFGSGRVNDSTQASLFFDPPSLSRRLLCTSFYQLHASNRLCYHSISCQKKKAVMQNKRDYHIYFLRVSSEPFITKEEPRGKMNATTCRMLNNFNCYYGNLLQSNND